MARGRPLTELTSGGEDRDTLTRWVRRPKTAQALAQRARIVLGAAEGRSDSAVAAELGLTARTVGKWRRRFLEQGPDGLLDEPRPGAPRTITDDLVEAVIVKTLEEKPTDTTHWSTRSMATEMGMRQGSISRIWRAFGLQPHRSESFELSTDPLFVEKVRDVVGLYLDPPQRAVALCVDEKSQIQALARFQPILPMLVGTPERRSHDYGLPWLSWSPNTGLSCCCRDRRQPWESGPTPPNSAVASSTCSPPAARSSTSRATWASANRRSTPGGSRNGSIAGLPQA